MEMEEIFDELFSVEEIDMDYEFDAPKFYDFTLLETDLEAQKAEFWFEIAGNYPPSPHIIEFKWRLNIDAEGTNSHRIDESSPIEADTNTSIDGAELEPLTDDNKIDMAQDITKAKAKTKSPVTKNASFMNPTASQLAKQHCLPGTHCERLLRRSQKLSVKREKSSPSSSMIDTQATKRQKLEAGYLCKVARLKHQALFLHKAPKKVGPSDGNIQHARPKVTIPKEFILETASRAERHRSKINLGSVENAKSNACSFTARPLNRKILKSPLMPLPKKSTPQLPEFQVFKLRTLRRAMQHAYVNTVNIADPRCCAQNEMTEPRRGNSAAALKEKLEALDEFKDRCLSKKEINFPTDDRLPNKLLIESFSKLSLASEVHSNPKSQYKMPLHSKGSKENAPESLCMEHENPAKSWRHARNGCQCGTDSRMASIGPRINRTLDIR